MRDGQLKVGGRRRGATLAFALLLALSGMLASPARPALAAGSFQVGVDAPSITSYGWGDLRPFAPSWDTPNVLFELQRMRGSLIRIYVGNCDVSDTVAASRLDSFLTQAAGYGVSVIASLINEYDTCQNNQAADSFYTIPEGYPLILDDAFFAGGYKAAFLPFVQTVVAINRYHPNVYAWEVGNELKDTTNTANFVSFMNDVAATIKSIAPNERVATGMLDAAHTGLTPAQLYPQLQNFDVITIHSFYSDHTGLADLDWAVQNGKIGIVEEEGISGMTLRWMDLAAEIALFQSHGAAALLYDGFIPQFLTDNGDGDRVFGLDTIWHRDYDEVFSTLAGATVGGQDLVLKAVSATQNQLTWVGGGQASGYYVARMSDAGTTVLTGGPLPASATAYLDTPPASDQYDCYAVVSVTGTTVLGNSDVLCRIPHIQAGSVVPSGFDIGLAQTPDAALTWGWSSSQTSYVFASLTPGVAGATWQTFDLTGNATGADFGNLQGQTTCFVLAALLGTSAIGNTDILCAIPGQASPVVGAPRAATRSSVQTMAPRTTTASSTVERLQQAAKTLRHIKAPRHFAHQGHHTPTPLQLKQR